MGPSSANDNTFWHPNGECWACLVSRHLAPASIVLANDEVIVVMNPFPLAPGHTLVLPKQHVRNLYARSADQDDEAARIRGALAEFSIER